MDSAFIDRAITLFEVPSAEQNCFIYGLNTVIVDTLDFLPVILIGIYHYHDLVSSITFILGLSILRQYTGGFHAHSIPACVFLYSMIFIVFNYLVTVLLHHPMVFLIASSSAVYQFLTAPILSQKKPMTDREAEICRKNARLSLAGFLFLILASCLQFRIFSLRLSIILILNFILMLIQQVLNHENSNSYNSR